MDEDITTTDNDNGDDIALDVEGDAVTMALAWAHAAHVPAGATWPAAFGYVAATATPPQGDAMEWLREIGLVTDRLVDVIADAEIRAGWGPGPRYPAWYEESGLRLVWDTSVSLILGPGKDPARLRLTLWGEHKERLALAREAIARPDRGRAIEAGAALAAYRRLAPEPAQAQAAQAQA